jgi:hypothetical protein
MSLFYTASDIKLPVPIRQGARVLGDVRCGPPPDAGRARRACTGASARSKGPGSGNDAARSSPRQRSTRPHLRKWTLLVARQVELEAAVAGYAALAAAGPLTVCEDPSAGAGRFGAESAGRSGGGESAGRSGGGAAGAAAAGAASALAPSTPSAASLALASLLDEKSNPVTTPTARRDAKRAVELYREVIASSAADPNGSPEVR